jgi:AbrB family looped-hinge helix DNA binding protein
VGWYLAGIVFGMRATIDSAGRIVVPKPFRDALGLIPGSTVDVSRSGAGLQVVPSGRAAQLVEEDGVLVATGSTAVDDEDVFGLIDAGRC